MQSDCSGWGELFDSLLEWAYPVVKRGSLNFDRLNCRWYLRLNSALCLLPIGINVNLVKIIFQKCGANCKGIAYWFRICQGPEKWLRSPFPLVSWLCFCEVLQSVGRQFFAASLVKQLCIFFACHRSSEGIEIWGKCETCFESHLFGAVGKMVWHNRLTSGAYSGF